MGLFRRRGRDDEADLDVALAPAQPHGQRDPRLGPDPVIDVNEPVSNPELIAAFN